MRICKIDQCNNPTPYKKYCAMHYKRLRYYNRTERVNKNWNGAHRHYNHKSIISMHKKRFGGLREIVLKRDNYRCVVCEMTNEEHIKKWSRNLTIDHIDGYGRKVKNPHNKIDNLQTLCLKCHGQIEAKRYWGKGV